MTVDEFVVERVDRATGVPVNREMVTQEWLNANANDPVWVFRLPLDAEVLPNEDVTDGT